MPGAANLPGETPQPDASGDEPRRLVAISRTHAPKHSPHNLPLKLSSFVGREREMAEVKRVLADRHLLTLTGPGGCGKTRLTLQVANVMVEGFEGGVWLVELASLADPALVPKTVASVLRVPEQPGRPLTETLSNCLKPKKTLLVRDNCEHPIEACAGLAEALLRTCPDLRILATSREQPEDLELQMSCHRTIPLKKAGAKYLTPSIYTLL